MKKALAFAAIIALSACSQDATDDQDTAAVEEQAATDPADAAGFEAVAPGAYDVVHADGTIDNLTIHPGMTWSTVFANGDAAGGTIFAQAGENCFVTEGVDGHQCFVGSPIEEDGSMQVTAEGGEVMTVKPAAE
ncbi:hypothetical protein GCM10009127_21150 [Alteraurantiacibacter aestuarii]|uniref:hypothetical protein n=1 Tax=Alteraurantiacibacter aestuarii TaxID=650004 RepID=UPI0031D0BFBE